MTQAQIMQLAIPAAILFLGFKYGNGLVKAGAVAVSAVAVAKQAPYLNTVV
jgi:hypothetical protein